MTRRSSLGVCPARSSNAHLAVPPVRESGKEPRAGPRSRAEPAVGIGSHRALTEVVAWEIHGDRRSRWRGCFDGGCSASNARSDADSWAMTQPAAPDPDGVTGVEDEAPADEAATRAYLLKRPGPMAAPTASSSSVTASGPRAGTRGWTFRLSRCSWWRFTRGQGPNSSPSGSLTGTAEHRHRQARDEDLGTRRAHRDIRHERTAVRGHEKVPTGGLVEVPGFGQVEVPTLRFVVS